MVKVTQATTQTPGQEGLMKYIMQALTNGSGPLAGIFGGFNQEEFQKGVANPAIKQFQEEILPQIQEKFIAGNQVGGSGFLRGQTKAAGDLQSQLAQLMYQAQQGQKQNQIAGVNTVLGTKAFENIAQPQNKSSIWETIIPALATAGGSFLGGPAAGALFGGIAKAGTQAATNSKTESEIG